MATTHLAGNSSALGRIYGGLLVLAVLTLAAPGRSQVNTEAYRDYFLVGRFGEVCAMCEVVVLCRAGQELPDDVTVPAAGDFTLYHLRTRTFWSQVSTIWEWFIANFNDAGLAARGHTRPVQVYQVSGTEWSAGETIEGRLVLDPGVLELGSHQIDRTSRAWRLADTGVEIGHCTRLPLWEALEGIDNGAPGNAP